MYFPRYDYYFSSDEFIQAQQQLARWASEDVVSVVLEPGSDSTTNGGVGLTNQHQSTGIHHGDTSSMAMAGNGGLLNTNPRDYYPSPASTETESSTSVTQPTVQLRRITHIDQGQGGAQLMETSGRYPEYKH